MKIVLAATIALIFLAATGVDAQPTFYTYNIKLDPDADAAAVISTITSTGVKATSVEPLIPFPKAALDFMSSVKEGLPDLSLWYKVVTTTTYDDEIFLYYHGVVFSQFQGKNWGNIWDVPPPPGATRARSLTSYSGTTPDLTPNQKYLGPQTAENNGIEAEYSWTVPGGTGTGITIYDIEYAWGNHEEFSGNPPDLYVFEDWGDNANLPFNPFDGSDSTVIDHGTAVMGVLIAGDNGFGTKGISYEAQAVSVAEHTTKYGHNRALAMVMAIHNAKPGDVILLQMQDYACGYGDTDDKYGPAEWDEVVFEATQIAVANGITVVAAAGNGAVDLDGDGCDSKFDRTVRDSGAIIVGAGVSGFHQPGARRERGRHSNYGSRVDLQGWGSFVYTTGYGDVYKDPVMGRDKTKWYTQFFDGTSSASAIVAGAVANIQGIAKKAFGAPLTPLQVRDLLTRTGTPQTNLAKGHIGPLPNLKKAIRAMFYPKRCQATRRPFRDRNNKKFSCRKLVTLPERWRKKKCKNDRIVKARCLSICAKNKCPCADVPFRFNYQDGFANQCNKMDSTMCQDEVMKYYCPGTCDKTKCPVARTKRKSVLNDEEA